MKKVVVIGFGFMGMTHTINILKNNKLELIAIVDIEADKIEEKLKREEGNFSTGDLDPDIIKGIHTYKYFSECIKNEAFDAVHICVHTNLHYSLAKEALIAGKHVLLEKPFCLDMNQGRELIALADKKKLTLMIAHVLRFMPAYQQLKTWIDTKEWGQLKFLSMSRFSGLPAWGQWKEKQVEFGSSGGALFDLLIHDIDFLNYSLGRPKKITSTYLPGKLSQHDYVSAWWDYPAFKVKVEGGNTFHSAFPFQANYMAEFENASVLYSTLDGDFIAVSDSIKMKRIPVKEGDGFFKEIDYFSECLTTHSKPEICMPESALTTIELCYKHV